VPSFLQSTFKYFYIGAPRIGESSRRLLASRTWYPIFYQEGFLDFTSMARFRSQRAGKSLLSFVCYCVSLTLCNRFWIPNFPVERITGRNFLCSKLATMKVEPVPSGRRLACLAFFSSCPFPSRGRQTYLSYPSPNSFISYPSNIHICSVFV
jgi:hypothetical protein